MKNPKYQQLNLSLSGYLFGGIYKRSRDSRKSQNHSYSPGALFDLFDITRPPCRKKVARGKGCLLYTSPSPRDKRQSRMPSSA